MGSEVQYLNKCTSDTLENKASHGGIVIRKRIDLQILASMWTTYIILDKKKWQLIKLTNGYITSYTNKALPVGYFKHLKVTFTV